MIFLLAPVGDAYELAKATGLIEKVMAKFASKSAIGILPEGRYLEAIGPKGDTVRIFRDNGDGTPGSMFTNDEVEGLRESTTEDCTRRLRFYVF